MSIKITENNVGQVIDNEANYQAINSDNFELIETGFYEYYGTWLPKEVYKVNGKVVIKTAPTFYFSGMLFTV